VSFEPANAGSKTHVHVELEYEPQGMVEKAGSAAQVDDAIVRADLGRFKELVEQRRAPTGEWSGKIEGGRVTEPDA
jgi:uncharacterized membrane protein